MTTAREWLDAAPGRYEDEWGCPIEGDLAATVAALTAVLDLHTPYATAGGRSGCRVCGSATVPASWPCPTVRAIDAALGTVTP